MNECNQIKMAFKRVTLLLIKCVKKINTTFQPGRTGRGVALRNLLSLGSPTGRGSGPQWTRENSRRDGIEEQRGEQQ